MARKVGLSHDDVVSAAGDVADRDGLGAVTLTTVATALGVKAPSLYAHVDGLEGLRHDLGIAASRELGVLMADAAAARTRDPRARLRAMCRVYRAFAKEHPGRYAAMLPAPRPEVDPDGAATAAATVTPVAEVLGQLGVPAARHVDGVRALRAMLHGFVDLENGGGFGLADPVDRSFAAAVDVVIAGLTAPSRGRR